MPSLLLSWASISITYVFFYVFFNAQAIESNKNYIEVGDRKTALFLLTGYILVPFLSDGIQNSIFIGIVVGYLMFNSITDWYDRIIYRATHAIVIVVGLFLVIKNRPYILYYGVFLIFLCIAAILKCYALGDTLEFASCGLLLAGLNLNLPDLFVFWVASIIYFLLWNIRTMKLEKDDNGKLVLLKQGSPVAPFIYFGFLTSLFVSQNLLLV